MEIYFYKTSSELKEINKDCELIERKECSLINDTDRTNPSLTIDKSLINSNIIFIPSFGRWYNLASVERLNNNWNKLEEEISNHIALCTDITLNDILDLMQELKGVDKE